MIKHNPSAPYQPVVFANMAVRNGYGNNVSFAPELKYDEAVLLFRNSLVSGWHILAESTVTQQDFAEYIVEVNRQGRPFKKDKFYASKSYEKIQAKAWELVKIIYPDAYTDNQ